jgi:hypothetical protein
MLPRVELFSQIFFFQQVFLLLGKTKLGTFWKIFFSSVQFSFSKLNNLPRLLEFHSSKLSILKHTTFL